MTTRTSKVSLDNEGEAAVNKIMEKLLKMQVSLSMNLISQYLIKKNYRLSDFIILKEKQEMKVEIL